MAELKQDPPISTSTAVPGVSGYRHSKKSLHSMLGFLVLCLLGSWAALAWELHLNQGLERRVVQLSMQPNPVHFDCEDYNAQVVKDYIDQSPYEYIMITRSAP